MVRVRGANDDTLLGFVIYLHYVQTRTPKGDKSTVKSYILAHPNSARTNDCINRKNSNERKEKRIRTCSFYSPRRPRNNYRNYYYIWR